MDTSTKFPYEVDDRVYFQDVDLDHVEAQKAFRTHYDSDDYDAAVEILQSSGILYYGADILNLIENRIVAIERFLLGVDQ